LYILDLNWGFDRCQQYLAEIPSFVDFSLHHDSE
jgi:hypothetical protein